MSTRKPNPATVLGIVALIAALTVLPSGDTTMALVAFVIVCAAWATSLAGLALHYRRR